MTEEQVREIVREEMRKVLLELRDELVKTIHESGRQQPQRGKYRTEPVRRSIWPWPFN